MLFWCAITSCACKLLGTCGLFNRLVVLAVNHPQTIGPSSVWLRIHLVVRPCTLQAGFEVSFALWNASWVRVDRARAAICFTVVK